MQYIILLNETDAELSKRDDPREAGEYWGGWNAFIGAMAAAGVIVHGNGLMPPALATTVQVRDGKRIVEDGPFPGTKESLGGYFLIEVPDLDAALEWAARAPSALTSSVEVRPIMPPPAQPGQM